MGELKEMWALGDKREAIEDYTRGESKGIMGFCHFLKTNTQFYFIFREEKRRLHLSIGKHAQPILASPHIGLHFEKSRRNSHSSSEKVS